MEKIEQILELPKLNAVIVAHKEENLSFLNILLSEEETTDYKTGYGWYLYFEHFNPNKKYSAAYIELEPEEVQFLQNTLNKALFKLIILGKVKIEGKYTLSYDGIKNLKLEMKSQNGNAWLELILFSSNQKKYVTTLDIGDVRAIIQKLQTVKTTGDKMVKQLETINALSENLVRQSLITQPTQLPAASQPIDSEHLVRHLETLAKKTKKVS